MRAFCAGLNCYRMNVRWWSLNVGNWQLVQHLALCEALFASAWSAVSKSLADQMKPVFLFLWFRKTNFYFGVHPSWFGPSASNNTSSNFQAPYMIILSIILHAAALLPSLGQSCCHAALQQVTFGPPPLGPEVSSLWLFWVSTLTLVVLIQVR